MAVLLLSTIDEGAAPVARALVLACFAVLTVINAGAATAVYIGAVAVFSVHHFAGQGSWVERPDNYAFLMLMGYLVLGRSIGRSVGSYGWTAAAIGVLLLLELVYLLSIVGFSTYEVSWYVRSFIMPLALFVVLRRAALSPREMRALLLGVAVLGVYLTAVSLFEVMKWYPLIIPPWLRDPTFNVAFGLDRAGGVPMQPEWNAIDISLALCVLLLRLDFVRGPTRAAWLVAGALCLLAVYFTYTRAAWLGMLVGGVPLFWVASGARGVSIRRRLAFLGGTLGFAAVLLFFPSEVLRNRAEDAGTVYFRLSIWIAGLEMIAQNPLLGVGFGQFAGHLNWHLRELVWIPSADAAKEGTLAHNTLLSIGAEFGLVGLLLYILILWGVYQSARDGARAHWGKRGSTWVAGYTLVYLVNLQFITAHKLTSNVLFFGIMGGLAGLRRVGEIGGRAGEERAVPASVPQQ